MAAAAPRRDLRLLCLDGGGIRGMVAIQVLRVLKLRTGKEPHQLFDMICGTSTGGILAVLLGLLKVPIDECEALFKALGEKVFDAGVLAKAYNAVKRRSRYSEDKLERLIKDTVTRYGGGNAESKMSDFPPAEEKTPTPRVLLVANRSGHPFYFRNYPDTESEDFGTQGTDAARVWEAVRATSAAPSYFAPITINGDVFRDGGMGLNNPSDAALVQAKRVLPWKGRDVKCLVSIGTGVPAHVAAHGGVTEVLDMLVRAATDCEKTHDLLEERSNLGDKYFRFNVSEGVGSIDLADASALVAVRQATQKYLASRRAIDEMDRLQRVLDGGADVVGDAVGTKVAVGDGVGVQIGASFNDFSAAVKHENGVPALPDGADVGVGRGVGVQKGPHHFNKF